MKALASITQRAGGFRRPYLSPRPSRFRSPPARATPCASARNPGRASGTQASASETASRDGAHDIRHAEIGRAARHQPPATEPVSIATPSTISAFGEHRVERTPVNPLAFSASTSHACTAPEKNVKPSPSRADATAQAQNGARPRPQRKVSKGAELSGSACPAGTKRRRPRTSAITPVGISKSTSPAVKHAVAGERLGVAQAGVEQEQRVDAPDERRGQGVKQQQDQIDALHAPGVGAHSAMLPMPVGIRAARANLFGAQRHLRIDHRGSASGDVARGQRHQRQQHRHDRERQRIVDRRFEQQRSQHAGRRQARRPGR